MFAIDQFLENDFDPVAYANQLVLQTSSSRDEDIDLDIPIKKISYDVQHLDDQVRELCRDNHKELLSRVADVSTKEDTLKALEAPMKDVNSSYKKLQTDVLVPYYQADNLYSALKRVHHTTDLLRSLTWYLYLAVQLNSTSDMAGSASLIRDLHTHAKVHPGLASLQIFRDHQKLLKEAEKKLTLRCVASVKGVSSVSTSAERNAISSAIVGLAILDERQLASAVQSALSNYISQSISLLARSVNSDESLEHAMHTISQHSRAVSTLGTLLSRAVVPAEGDDEAVTAVSELPRIADLLDSNLNSKFWRDVASALNLRIKERMTRATPGLKSLQQNHAKLETVVAEAVSRGGGGLTVDGLEAKVMKGALAPLK
ncbi:hypothetical protein CJU89_2550 [Yarrowia sp. B02]|nr:hypothetical protein CJU89_2550 [Yarrowia sp. B02]